MENLLGLTGAILVGRETRQGVSTFQAFDPVKGTALAPSFHEAGAADVAAACSLAEQAFPVFSELDLEARARFLETVAQQIAALGDALIERAILETGLPRPRLEGERGRTIAQLQLFAGVIREGAWMDVTIDTALPNRAPVPRPDLRRRHIAIGPVAVFGASNFPLAFSVAGGDTAAAFAAGCPVVVKGHPAHPGTGELVALAVKTAVAKCGLPEGVFSYLPGTTTQLGAALVADPHIKAVAFTGSRSGGLALVKIAGERREPIPVYAEMSSINPVLLFPGAARTRAAELAKAYVASLTLGAGQFCTNPGVLIALSGRELDSFIAAAEAALAQTPAQPMLTAGIYHNFKSGAAALAGHTKVRTIAGGAASEGANSARGALFTTDAATFIADAALSREVFGASSVIVSAQTLDEMVQVVSALEGQLTATLLFDEADEPEVASLIPTLEQKVGRILANGWPTGVEVCHAMVHGGPYPATSDSRTTSVGTLAIERFLRPVCYQNLPDRLLPAALRANNPCKVPRRIDGVMTAR